MSPLLDFVAAGRSRFKPVELLDADDICHLDSTSFLHLCSPRDDLPERGAFPAGSWQSGSP